MDFHKTHSEGHTHSVQWWHGMYVLQLTTNTSDSVKLRPCSVSQYRTLLYKQCVLWIRNIQKDVCFMKLTWCFPITAPQHKTYKVQDKYVLETPSIIKSEVLLNSILYGLLWTWQTCGSLRVREYDYIGKY